MQREHRQASRTGRRALALVGALALTVAGAGTAFASDNPIADKEWALKTLQSNTAQSKYGAHGAGVVVAVIDSGVDPNQPDLQGSLLPGINLVNPENPGTNTSDDNSESHGTSIATIIAGHGHDRGGTQTGMIGLADQAKILPIKTGVGEKGGSNIATDAAVKYATDHGARVINISYGTNGDCPQDVVSAIDYALSHNVVVVVATGNTALSGNQVGCPAPIPGVIDVAAFGQNGQMDKFSHYGSDVSVAAPGVAIEIGLIGAQYGQNNGSSLAAPWVSAEAALIIGLHPTWTQGQVVAAIIDNTAQVVAKQTQVGKRYDDHIGYGIIDPLAALGAAEPASTANPLGGPAVTASGGASGAASSIATSPGGSGNQTPTAGGGKSSSSVGLIAGVIIAVIVVGGLVLFFVTRGNRRGGSGGPGGGGGGGGNGYYPPTPPGGQYAQPPQGYQQPGPYQQQLPQQGSYQPQQGGGGGGYEQQQQPGGYGQQQQPQPGGYGQQQQPQPGGYGQQQPGAGNPYQGR